MVGLLVLLFLLVPIAGATRPEAEVWDVEGWEEPSERPRLRR